MMKDELEEFVRQMHATGILYSEAVREFKKRFILLVLKMNRGNQCKAAKELGMHRNTLSRTIAELGMQEEVDQLNRHRLRKPRVPRISLSRPVQPAAIAAVVGVRRA